MALLSKNKVFFKDRSIQKSKAGAGKSNVYSKISIVKIGKRGTMGALG